MSTSRKFWSIPANGNNVLVCATGHLWDDNDERGVYKTTDGGKTWNKVLAGANGSTGCGLLAISRQEPKTIYASMWDFRRQGWTFRSGGPGSGLFKSTDGGDHWTEITDSNAQRPAGETLGTHRHCRRAFEAEVVYANIEAEEERAVTAPTTRRNTGRSSMPATSWCGVRFISAT